MMLEIKHTLSKNFVIKTKTKDCITVIIIIIPSRNIKSKKCWVRLGFIKKMHRELILKNQQPMS